MQAVADTLVKSTNSIDNKRVLLLTSLGAGFEYYDFSIFAFFAAIIGKLFFHIGVPALSLIAGYAVFAVGTVARLFGGMIFSYFGDKYGRKITFIYTIFFMAVPSLIISALPTYAQIGMLAPVLLLILRVLQGAAAGGEIPTAVAFIAESYSDKNRTFACACLLSGIFLGFFLAAFVQLLLSHWLTAEQLQQWGWRLAYLLGGSLGVIGFIIRKKLRESPAFIALKAKQQLVKNPLAVVLQQYRARTFFTFLINAIIITFVFIFFTYLPNYLVITFDYTVTYTALANSLGILLSILSMIFFGFLSRKINKKIIFVTGCLVFFISCYPIFIILSQLSNVSLFSCFALVGVFSGLILAPAYSIMVDQFPATIRISGIGISLNLATIVFGALGTEICAMLVAFTADKAAPAFFLMACSVISCIGLWMSRKSDPAKQQQDDDYQ